MLKNCFAASHICVYLDTCPPVHHPDKLKPQQLGQESIDPAVEALRKGPYCHKQDGLKFPCAYTNGSKKSSTHLDTM